MVQSIPGWASLVVLGGALLLIGEASDLTIKVSAGAEECFFEMVHEAVNKTLFIDYTVIAASQGELDINFQTLDPYSRPMVTEFRKSESSHSFPIAVDGLYKLCFDNTFSHFSVKTVAFGISIEDDEEAHWGKYDDIDFVPEGQYDMTVDEISTKTDLVRIALHRIIRVQEEFREVESRDRSVSEHNFERVNFWSFVNLFIVVTVGFIQVIMVKKLFEDKSISKKGFRL